MDKLTTFYLLLLFYLVGENFLQGNLLSLNKRRLNKYMLSHIGIITIAFLIPLVRYPLGKAILGTIIIFLSHLIIDITMVEINKLLKLNPEKYFYWVLYGIDQMLHLTSIFLVLTFIL